MLVIGRPHGRSRGSRPTRQNERRPRLWLTGRRVANGRNLRSALVLKRIDTSTAVGRMFFSDPRRRRRVRTRPHVRTHPRRPGRRSRARAREWTRGPSSHHAKRRSLKTCTTSSAPMAAVPIPCSKSLTSSASRVRRSTATYSARRVSQTSKPAPRWTPGARSAYGLEPATRSWRLKSS